MIHILWIDLGKNTGWAFSEEEYWHWKLKDILDFDTKVKDLVDLYKPDVIITAYPVRFYNAIVSHSKYMWVLEVIAWKRDIPLIQVNDSQCKKAIFWKWKVTKEEIQKRYKCDNEHSADAMMFREYLQTQQN